MRYAQYATVEEYLTGLPSEHKALMQSLRAFIHAQCPEVEESISYAMPAFRYRKKILCYMGSFKQHVGFFPGAGAVAQVIPLLQGLKHSKGTIQLLPKESLPEPLIQAALAFRIKEIQVKGR